jgi:chloramphenicol 3-O-phosphotransferase
VASVLMLSGPAGAGKTTVAGELARSWAGPLACIEGDRFWPMLVKRKEGDRREDFRVLMRSMTAAAVPLARSGYDVLLDFSFPPAFLSTARAILKEVPIDFVVLRPSLGVCRSRFLERKGGKTLQSGGYEEFYALFEAEDRHTVCDDTGDASALAGRILGGLAEGRFRVGAA